MNRKTAIIALILLISAAVIFGLVLVNKGDGPVMGMIIADKMITGSQDYETKSLSKDKEVYLVVEKEFNKFSEKYKADIPSGNDLYAGINLVECPKGARFTGIWLSDGKKLKEEAAELSTNQKGVVSYMLDGKLVMSGNMTFELYDEDKMIFSHSFSIK